MRPFDTIISLILFFATFAVGTATALGEQRDTNGQDLQGLPLSSEPLPLQDGRDDPSTTPGDSVPDAPDLDIHTTPDSAEAACPGDVDLDNRVEITDLLAIVADWGECSGCATDFNSDGFVDINDLLVFISNWGRSCP